MFVMKNENYSKYPTMLFCNPNGAQYETIFHDTRWANFYLSQGMNIFLWNYRGFGESSGVPDPNVLEYN